MKGRYPLKRLTDPKQRVFRSNLAKTNVKSLLNHSNRTRFKSIEEQENELFPPEVLYPSKQSKTKLNQTKINNLQKSLEGQCVTPGYRGQGHVQNSLGMTFGQSFGKSGFLTARSNQRQKLQERITYNFTESVITPPTQRNRYQQQLNKISITD